MFSSIPWLTLRRCLLIKIRAKHDQPTDWVGQPNHPSRRSTGRRSVLDPSARQTRWVWRRPQRESDTHTHTHTHTIIIKKSCGANTGEWPVRQKSAARRELKTEASWAEFLEWNIGRQKLDKKGVKGVEQLSLNTPAMRSRQGRPSYCNVICWLKRRKPGLLGRKYCEKRKVFSLALKDNRLEQCLRSCKVLQDGS